MFKEILAYLEKFFIAIEDTTSAIEKESRKLVVIAHEFNDEQQKSLAKKKKDLEDRIKRGDFEL